MNICGECFSDSEIVRIINSSKQIGICEITHSERIPVINITYAEEIKNIFRNIIEAYTEVNPSMAYGDIQFTSRYDVITTEWNLFSKKIGKEQVHEILKEIFYEEIEEDYKFLEKNVYIEELNNKDYLAEHSILRVSWDEFVSSLKYKNRYWPIKYINQEPLYRILKVFIRDESEMNCFYRARICDTKNGFLIDEMKAPPSAKASEGRLNPLGISRLYLADSEETAIHEVRASEYDFVCIAEFNLKNKIKIIDLRQIEMFSVSILLNIMPVADVVINRNFLMRINEEMSRALRRDDSKLDYIPTQFIADFIETIDGIDGIVYKSTMNSNGYNLLLFNEKSVECKITPVVYKIKEVDFVKETIDSCL